MDAPSSYRLAANDRCTVRRATPFHHNHLKSVLDAATAASMPVFPDFDASRLLVEQDVFLAYAQDRPIGCIMAMPGETTVLHGLFVVPGERGRGHGSELIRQAIAEFEGGGVTRTYWTAVDPVLLGAQERFLKFGFVVVPELCEDRLELMVRRASMRTGGTASFPSERAGRIANASTTTWAASAG